MDPQHDLIRSLAHDTGGRIILLVIDGLGGLATRPGEGTALEMAVTPHLDRLARDHCCGLVDPVTRGITPGSGSGHLGLFGYDPLRYRVGRGVLAALGIGLELGPGEVAARGNFCSLDEAGRVTDRRAGRLDDETGRRLVELLADAVADLEVEGGRIRVAHVKEYRFVVACTGDDLGEAVADTDPQRSGVQPAEPTPGDAAAERTAALARAFVARAGEVLAETPEADGVLLRGFGSPPSLPSLADMAGLHPLAVAAYPMYRGLARLVGMEAAPSYHNLEEAVAQVVADRSDHDFVFMHVKDTDRAGEDGDVAAKVAAIEAVDAIVPHLLETEPAVLAVTGDHSTPCPLRSHSFHPVPMVLAAQRSRRDAVERFGETACVAGGLGRLRGVDVLTELLAHAGRLAKFGA